MNLKKILTAIVNEIIVAKQKAEMIHTAGDIKAAGDEIEELIRSKISLFLPEKYLVKHGHIINSKGQVSNQLDIIIFDRLSTPKFFESQNESVYYPIESVLAIGEIKKSLRDNHLLEIGEKIKFIK